VVALQPLVIRGEILLPWSLRGCLAVALFADVVKGKGKAPLEGSSSYPGQGATGLLAAPTSPVVPADAEGVASWWEATRPEFARGRIHRTLLAPSDRTMPQLYGGGYAPPTGGYLPSGVSPRPVL
jgi:hypothetical protein